MTKIKISQMKYFRYYSYKKRNGKNAYDDRVQKETDLKIQGLFAILIYEAVIFFVCGP